MTWIANFGQAAVIMVIGMGVVFLFLAALIFMMQIAARIIAKADPPSAPVTAAAPLSRNNEGAIIAAITAAVKQYSADKQNRQK